MKRYRPVFRLIALGALLGAIGYLAFNQAFLQSASLKNELQHFGQWAPVVFVVIYAFGAILFVPGSILTIAGGALFGPLRVTPCNLSGATLGATLAFLIARYVASDWVTRTAGARLAGLMRGVEEEGWRFVAFVRLVPLFPFNLVNYAFGLTRIRIGEYVLASFVCMVPGALAYTWLGYAGREAALGQSAAIREGLLALALVAGIAFLPRLIRRLKRRRFIDATELKRRLDKGERPVLLDVRTEEEFLGPLGHISGAKNIPVGDLAREIGTMENRQKPLVTI